MEKTKHTAKKAISFLLSALILIPTVTIGASAQSPDPVNISIALSDSNLSGVEGIVSKLQSALVSKGVDNARINITGPQSEPVDNSKWKMFDHLNFPDTFANQNRPAHVNMGIVTQMRNVYSDDTSTARLVMSAQSDAVNATATMNFDKMKTGGDIYLNIVNGSGLTFNSGIQKSNVSISYTARCTFTLNSVTYVTPTQIKLNVKYNPYSEPSAGQHEILNFSAKVSGAGMSDNQQHVSDTFNINPKDYTVSAPTVPSAVIQGSLSSGILNGGTAQVKLYNAKYAGTLSPSEFTLYNAPSGLTVASVTRDADDTATLTFAYSGTLTSTDSSFYIVVGYSALANGQAVTFTGYGANGYKDFAIMPNTSINRKTFQFTLDSSAVTVHALEGAGFLFDTTLQKKNPDGSFTTLDEYTIDSSSLSNEYITGYYVMIHPDFDGSGNTFTGLYKFDNVSLEELHNSTNSVIDPDFANLYGYDKINGITRLGDSVQLQGSSSTRFIKIVADNDAVNNKYAFSMTEYTDNTYATMLDKPFDSYALPTSPTGGSYGPLISYQSHNCAGFTQYEFADITMTSIFAKDAAASLSSGTWSSDGKGSNFLVNINNQSSSVASTDSKLADFTSNLINNNISYIGAGLNNTISTGNTVGDQANRIISYNNGNGTYIDLTSGGISSVDDLANAIADYIAGKVNTSVSQPVTIDNAVVGGKLTLSAANPGGTISSYEWSLIKVNSTGSGTVMDTATTPTYTPPTLSSGEYIVELVAKDGAGNTLQTKSIRLSGDPSAKPIASFTLNETNINPVTPISAVSTSYHPALLDIKKYEWRILDASGAPVYDSGVSTTLSALSTKFKDLTGFSGLAEGQYTLQLKVATDNASADNWSDYLSKTLVYANPDTDKDGIPDYMDDDIDGDGVPNSRDLYPYDPTRSFDPTKLNADTPAAITAPAADIAAGTAPAGTGANPVAASVHASDIANAVNGQNVNFTVGNVSVDMPVEVLDSKIGADTATSTLKLIKSDITDTQKQNVASLIPAKDSIVLSFQLTLEKSYSNKPDIDYIHQLGAKIKVTVALTDEMISQITDVSHATLYYYDTTGSTPVLTDMNATFNMADKTVTFYTDHFSTFIVKQGVTPTADAPAATTTPVTTATPAATTTPVANPKTGENNNIPYMPAIFLMTATVGIAGITKKKKSKRA